MKFPRKIFNKLFRPAEYGFLRDCKNLARYDIGEWTHGHFGLQIANPEGGTVRIGKFCSIAPGVIILLGGEHRKDWVSTYAFPVLVPGAENYPDYSLTNGDVIVGHDVWIGLNAIIMSGVTLADGMVVGAGSVVRRNFPPYSIVAGNPAVLAGYRFPKEIIDELLKIRWWDWPIEKIRAAFPLMLSPDIGQFVAKHRVTPAANVTPPLTGP